MEKLTDNRTQGDGPNRRRESEDRRVSDNTIDVPKSMEKKLMKQRPEQRM